MEQRLPNLQKKDARIVVLDADLMRANGTFAYKERFPDRWIDVGVAEANMIGIAAGLLGSGYGSLSCHFYLFCSKTYL